MADGSESGTHNIILKAGTEPLNLCFLEIQFLCKMLLSLRMSTFQFSKLNFEGDSLLPQLLGFRALLVLQTLPLVHLAFEIRITPLKFSVGILDLVLFILDPLISQRLAFEGRL